MKITRALMGLSLLAAGCGGDDKGEKGSGPSTPQTGVFGVVHAADGAPIGGARVEVGGVGATADAEGGFALTVSAGYTVATVAADGFVTTTLPVAVTDGAHNAVHVWLLPAGASQPLDASTGGEVTGARGAHLTVPAGALVDANGATAEGMVQVRLTPLDPWQPNELRAAPGDFSAVDAGGQRVFLESFGMMDITITQGDGELNVAPGQTLEVRIPASPDGPETMPLWSLDEATGRWVEEGTLTRDGDVYVGALPHLSFWNADVIAETTCVTGTVVDDASGTPMAGALVQSRGVGFGGGGSARTNAEGRFVLLARTNSTVEVLASHADGGGQARQIMTGATVAQQPARLDDPACTDAGEWRVRPGEVELPDGQTIECDMGAFGDFQRCLPLIMEMATCHAPSGDCQYEGGALNYRFSNGARVETDIDTSTGSVTTIYYGPGDVLCGRQTVTGASGQVQVTMPDGRTGSYGIDVSDGANGRVTYTCADGSSRTIDTAVMSACFGGNAEQNECAPDPNAGNGGVCADDTECSGGEVCCGLAGNGLCMRPENCPLYRADCETDAECMVEGNVCCPSDAGSYCTSRLNCLNTGWCGGDSDCDGEVCCDGRCESRPFCEGECRVGEADCGDGGFCCPDENSDYNFCTESERACRDDSLCEADADCGGEATGLICCPNANGSRCSTLDECHNDTLCGPANAEICPAGTMCCLRFDPNAGFCSTEANCLQGTPCAASAECGQGGVCCRSQFFEEDVCIEAVQCAELMGEALP